MDAMDARPLEILLVEDNVGDVQLTREAMREGRLRGRLHGAEDGVEALRFLRRESPYTDAPRPDLVLLDLNLPRKAGHEVLAELKADADLCTIPVVVLTTSQSPEDVLRVYRMHANAFITKPVDLESFLRVMKSLEEFWFNVARLPSRA
jgi:two-component system, chemotaxis family, response regulator Rcp1